VYTSPDTRGPIIYFDVDDIDAAIRKTRELGGTSQEKLPVPAQGWFAGCTDTEGNPFSLWQDDKAAPMPEEQAAEAPARS
jgi:predicted enzyme related to lactoylglutathione lyase